MNGNWINLVGLAFDIVGASLLGLAVVLNSKEKIAQQVATAWSYNRRLVPAIVEQRVDGVAGLGFLVIGFTLQAVSDFWPGGPWEATLGLSILGGALALYRMIRPRLVKLGSKRVIDFIDSKQLKRSNSDAQG